MAQSVKQISLMHTILQTAAGVAVYQYCYAGGAKPVKPPAE
jgi:hypothetical protein